MYTYTYIIVISNNKNVMILCISGPQEYCQWEEFSAQCAEDEMVVFTNAVYGRMRLGRCVNRDFGFIGCGTNVLTTMHRECSGRRECQFGVTNLHGNHDCSNDLTAYLAASYECVKGKCVCIWGAGRMCFMVIFSGG